MNGGSKIFQVVQEEEKRFELFHAYSFLVIQSALDSLELLIHVPLVCVPQEHLGELKLRDVPFSTSKSVELELEHFSLKESVETNAAKSKNSYLEIMHKWIKEFVIDLLLSILAEKQISKCSTVEIIICRFLELDVVIL